MITLRWWALALLALFALFSWWQWQRWKAKVRRQNRDLAIWREALHSMAFETTNAVNAIRANLLDFRQANPSAAMPRHLDGIETGTHRIAAVLRIADDPVAWHRRKNAAPAPVKPTGPQPAAPMLNDPIWKQ